MRTGENRMKKNKNQSKINKLRADLHYFQGCARIEARVLEKSREKCKQIAAEMRRLQQEGAAKVILEKSYSQEGTRKISGSKLL
jgi:hypothetical protein